MKDMNVFLGNIDDVAINCYKGIQSQLTDGSIIALFNDGNLVENLLYNAGYMYLDIQAIVKNDPTTKTNWSYFVAYHLGDFLLRFVYKSV